MNEILSWLTWGAGALLLVAVVVAGWEHLVREAAALRPDCGARASDYPVVVTVDVRLDTQAAALAAEPVQNERDTRVAAMTEALSRAAVPAASQARRDGSPWMDTTPRVLDLNEPSLRDRSER